MKVELNLNQHFCKVTRDANDLYFRRGGYSDVGAESTFLYHVQQALKDQGYDVIKKRMWRDGHLVDDAQQYIRTRSGLSKQGDFAIWNSSYAIYDAGERFNEDGEITLAVELVED